MELKERILTTLRFFDLQDLPLTLVELQQFLINDLEKLRQNPESPWLWTPGAGGGEAQEYSLGDILFCINNNCQQEVGQLEGYYFLTGRESIVKTRLENYLYGLKREKLIRRYLWLLKFLPFVRGVAIGGSQSLGQQKPGSDIDLLIITDKDFLWIARTLVTAYFQVFGRRRHGKKITDRFCLNHYVAGIKELERERDMYNAMEYLRLRPQIYENNIAKFQHLNWPWVKHFFPNFKLRAEVPAPQKKIQKYLEKIFTNRFGAWLNKSLQQWQLPRARLHEYVIADPAELSFHSKERKLKMLRAFFEH